MTGMQQDSDQILANKRTITEMIEAGTNDLGIVESYVNDKLRVYSDLLESSQSNPNFQWPERADEHLSTAYWNTRIKTFNDIAAIIRLISATRKEIAT